MMKQVNIHFPLRMLGLILGLFLSVSAFAQIEVKGHVKDATGEDIIGATVRVDGTQTATVTDFGFGGERCAHLAAPAPGVSEILCPGELEAGRAAYNRVHGIQMGRGAFRELCETCAEFGVADDPFRYVLGEESL